MAETVDTDYEDGVELTDDPARQHVWKAYGEDDSHIDIFAYELPSYHNGPRCSRCGQGFCHHCEPDCYRYTCPSTQPKEKTR